MIRATNASTPPLKSALVVVTMCLLTGLSVAGCSRPTDTRQVASAPATSEAEGSDQTPDARPSAEPSVEPVAEVLSLPEPADEFQFCVLVWELSSFDNWALGQGLSLDSEPSPTPIAWDPAGANGNALSCGGNRLIVTVLDATDTATADAVVAEFGALDELFPDAESAAYLAGATGSYSYLSDSSGTLSSLDLRRDLRVVTVQHTAVLKAIDETATRQMLQSVAGVALNLTLPGATEYAD